MKNTLNPLPSFVAEKFICKWTCAESLEELKRDDWSTSDVHSILMDFILSQNAELRKDKERLDWLLNCEGKYWLINNREDIDREMEDEQ